MNTLDSLSERVVILAPQGRDATVAQSLLAEADVQSAAVGTLSALISELHAGAAAVLLAEEAVIHADLSGVGRWIEQQPAWSDLAFILLTRQGGGPERNPAAAHLSKVLGNVTFLERPFHPTTLISLVQTALRGRRRQYEARSRLEELRASEDKLRDLNATLEQRVAQEVNERATTEEALRQSQKMEVVGQLTGGVAHDFNNLLTIIRTSVDLLRRPGLSEERRGRYVDAVSDTVDRASKLTGQLLAFARRQTLQPEVFDIADRLHSIAEMVDTVTGSRIHVATVIEESRCLVKADLSQFETAILNMAVNARDAMQGEGTLTLRLECSKSMPAIRGHAPAPGPFVVVSLSDTGQGIAPEHLSKIFEPFFTTKEVGKGTGLGLSQVFGFAKQSGGDVTVTSTLGAGTTFRLYLPQAAESTETKVAENQTLPAINGGGQNVLVVEDNLEVGHFAMTVLRDLGYETTWATNAEEALDQLAKDERTFDVVFSDVVMPGTDGIELAKRLRESLPNLPVVLASGYSQILALEGTQGFELLPKPYSADQLSAALQHVIAKYKTRASCKVAP